MSDSNDKINGAFPNEVNKNTTEGINISNVMFPGINMNAMLKGAQEYSRLNTAVNSLIGMEVKWFRSIPQQRSQDVIFQEYTLYQVDETPLCIKVVLPDGNFPDSKYTYDLMGLEYEVPLEINIDKRYWENMSGYGTAPQKNDIVYFPIPNKLYEVVSSYLYRGFYEQETTWKINLRKYQPESSRKEGTLLQQTIEKYAPSTDDIFGEKIKSDIKKLSNDKQMSPFNSTSKDKYKVLDSLLSVIPLDLNIYGMTVAESCYNLETSKYYTAVKYNGSDDIKYNNRCLTSWFMIDPSSITEYYVSSLIENSNLNNGANYEMEAKISPSKSSVSELVINTNIEISRPGAINFYAKVIDVSLGLSGPIYQLKIDEQVKNYLSSIKNDWASITNYKFKIQDPVSILNSIDNTLVNSTEFKINIYANQYIKIIKGKKEYVSIIPYKLNNKEWYGIIVNMDNSSGIYDINIYKQSDTNEGSKLTNVFNEHLLTDINPLYVDYYYINKSPSYITNIRLYNDKLNSNNYVDDLLSYFIKDGDQLIIGDNADVRFNGTYTGQQH